MRDLLEHRLCRQPLLHQTRHHVLKEESVEAAHHHDGVEDHQERRHRSAEPETAVQNHERDGQDREPDMRAQPALHRADAPERNFFPQTQQHRENKNRQRDRAEPKAERRAADRVMLSWSLDQRRRHADPRRQRCRMKIARVKNAGRDRRQQNENDPGNVPPIINPHRSVRVMRLVTARGRPFVVEELVLHFERVAEEALRIDPLRGIVRAGIHAARHR